MATGRARVSYHRPLPARASIINYTSSSVRAARSRNRRGENELSECAHLALRAGAHHGPAHGLERREINFK